MLSPPVQKAINEQIRAEFQSSYAYLAMAAHCEAMNFPGFGRWLRAQSQEEWGHGMKLYDFLGDRGARPVLEGLDKPKSAFASVLEVMEAALAHERQTTELIHGLYEVAGKERDYATQAQLQWFLTEQVEEEKTVGLVVEQLRMAGSQPAALLMLDRQMGLRAAGPEPS